MRTDLPDVACSGASLLAMHVRSYVEELTASLNAFSHSALASVVDVLERARKDQRGIFIIGNGGSAATASHMACDLAKGTVDQRNPELCDSGR